MFSEHLQLSSAAITRSYTKHVESVSLAKRKKRKMAQGVNVSFCGQVFESATVAALTSRLLPLWEATHLWCVSGWTFWPYCPSCCLLSQITFWHSSLLSESLRWLWPKASGGPNDKASLTISRQEHGSEWGNWTVRERRGERRSAGEEGGAWGGGTRGAVTLSCKMEPVIICSFGAHQSLPSLAHTAPLTFLPLWHPFPFICLPSVLLSLVTTFPFFKDCIVHLRQCSLSSYMLLLTLLLLSTSSNLRKAESQETRS